ncbi:MAG: hypothetical protein J6K38_02525 [Alistipes sp.]|nr:hypothetical protein [Alistipes sp.]
MTRNIIMSVLAVTVTVGNIAAQRPLSVTAEGRDALRGRLIPYPTAEEAATASMQRQRYMQPLEEWQQSIDDDGATVMSASFTVPFSWIERQTFLRVEGAGVPYEVIINGRTAGYAQNGFAASEYNITKLSHEDKNRVEIRLLDRAPLAAVESFPSVVGVPLRAYIISQPRVRIRDVFSRTRMGVGGRANVDIGIIVHNQTLNAKRARIYYDLYSPDTVRVATGYKDVELGMYGIDTVRFAANIPDSELWRAGSPEMYRLELRNRIAGRDVEFYSLPVGFRSVEYADGEFLINGRSETMRRADVDASVAARRIVELQAEGYNAVRFEAGHVAEELLSLCDSLGMYVFLTAAIDSSSAGESRRVGGNPSNDPAWRATYVDRGEMLIETTKRHPSVVVYSPAQHSANGICLYDSYLAMKMLAGERPVFYTDGGGEWNDDSKK